jgi:CheY-like chemotaxis protein
MIKMDSQPGASPICIMLVEDNEGDVRLTKEAIKESKIHNTLTVAMDGEEAMEMLFRKGKHADVPRPDLILLDLNLPRMDGREVLSAIKENPDLKSIPVVILTTSQAEEDLLKTYAMHANCYIVKPVDITQFARVVQLIQDFWFTIVKLPPKS